MKTMKNMKQLSATNRNVFNRLISKYKSKTDIYERSANKL